MKLKFNNGKFVILQVSDAQDLQFVRHTMIRMLNKAYDTVKPDLVVFTGDNILGNHLRDARFGSRKVVHTKQGELERMKTAINHIIAPVEKRGIPFAMLYGNHDDMNWITKDEQADIYRSYTMCRGLDNPDKTVDCDTYNMPVYSSDGEKVVYNIWMMDTAWKDKEEDKCYTGVKKEAVEWYKRTSDELKKQNGGKVVPSLMFQHIPLPECMDLMEECKKTDDGALRFFRDGEEERYVRLDKKKADGFLGEPIMGYDIDNGQFEAVKEKGDVQAIVLGHEHMNNYIGVTQGVKIIQSSAASFRCYGDRLRGVRVFVLDENDLSDVNTYFLTYNELCGKNLFTELAYIWDADGEGKKKAALIAGVGVAAVAVTATAVSCAKKKKGERQ
ncbi:MAG: metallophosphoesterase [Clostridia bacterium]|nr:metallophosphoesterase [Clostridia bacterium]